MGFLVPRRATEATASQLVASGAAGGYGADPLDAERGWRPLGPAGREVPWWTLERARMFGVAAYRINPMARGIIDTYTSFCVGDSGLTLQCQVPEVRAIAEEFWNDPANRLRVDQELMLRSAMLNGERADELMVGPVTGAVRRSIIDPARIEAVGLRDGNPLWPGALYIRNGMGDPVAREVIDVDPVTGLRAGDVQFGRWWRALETDSRGYPFLGPVLDWLDSYDTVLANLIDRTALARYLVWDVTVTGDQNAVNDFIAARGGRQAPRSGSVEVHNDKVEWEPKTAQVGAREDQVTAQTVLTNVAAGAGLAKTWLAEPEDANRATSMSMAEPVRRRLGAVQNQWLAYVTDMSRVAVDQAVRVGRLPMTIQVPDGPTLTPAETVTVTGPEIADSPAQVGAEVLANLSKSMVLFRKAGLLSQEAAELATRKAWEDFVGVPWRSELSGPDVDTDDLATLLDDQKSMGALDALFT